MITAQQCLARYDHPEKENHMTALELRDLHLSLPVVPTLAPEFVQCWKDAGFDWGGEWKGKFVDGMHFQLREFPK